MYMLFQDLFFIYLNLYRFSYVHIKYHEYITIYIFFNISPFLITHNVFGYQKTNVEVLRHTVHKDTSV